MVIGNKKLLKYLKDKFPIGSEVYFLNYNMYDEWEEVGEVIGYENEHNLGYYTILVSNKIIEKFSSDVHSTRLTERQIRENTLNEILN